MASNGGPGREKASSEQFKYKGQVRSGPAPAYFGGSPSTYAGPRSTMMMVSGITVGSIGTLMGGIALLMIFLTTLMVVLAIVGVVDEDRAAFMMFGSCLPVIFLFMLGLGGGIPAIILSAMGRRHAVNELAHWKGRTTTGLLLGIIAVTFSGLSAILMVANVGLAFLFF